MSLGTTFNISPYVKLTTLAFAGADGFRLDAAKSINPADLMNITARLKRKPSYITQEVIWGAGVSAFPSYRHVVLILRPGRGNAGHVPRHRRGAGIPVPGAPPDRIPERRSKPTEPAEPEHARLGAVRVRECLRREPRPRAHRTLAQLRVPVEHLLERDDLQPRLPVWYADDLVELQLQQLRRWRAERRQVLSWPAGCLGLTTTERLRHLRGLGRHERVALPAPHRRRRAHDRVPQHRRVRPAHSLGLAHAEADRVRPRRARLPRDQQRGCAVDRDVPDRPPARHVLRRRQRRAEVSGQMRR
jgi:hypothetical protein